MTLKELEEICFSLKASQQASRKEAWKRMDAALGGEILIRELDKSSSAKAETKLAVNTWPGLCSHLLNTILKEFQHNLKQKVLDSSARATQRCFRQAQNVGRHGRHGMLARAAPRIFLSMFKILLNVGLSSPLGEVLGTILKEYLLPVKQCIQLAKAEVVEGLIELHLDAIESQPDGRIERVQTLQLLLQNFPGQLHSDSRTRVQDFLTCHWQQVTMLDQKQPLAPLQCVNAFLLRNGLDMFSSAGLLHSGFRGYVLKLAKVAPQEAATIEVQTYFQIQIALGALEDTPVAALHLSEVAEWALSELEKVNQTLAVGKAMSRQQEDLVELCADATFRQISQKREQKPEAPEEGSSDEGHAPKRRRRGGFMSLRPEAQASPAAWMALTSLLRRNGFRLRQTLLEEWLTAALSVLMDSEGQRPPHCGGRPKEDMQLVGVLAFLGQLAKAWLFKGLLGAGQQASTHPEAKWLPVATAAVQLLEARSLGPLGVQEVHRLLIPLSELGLAGWLLQRLTQVCAVEAGGRLSRLQMLLISSTTRPRDGKQGRLVGSAQAALLSPLLAADCAENPMEAGDAILALMGARPATNIGAALHDMPWRLSTTTDKQLMADLAALRRGEDFVAEKALDAALSREQRCERPCTLLPRPQQQAATILMTRLDTAASREPGGDLAHLQELITTAVLCTRIMTALHSARHEASAQGQTLVVEPAWNADGALAGALKRALLRLASVLSGCIGGGQALQQLSTELLQHLFRSLEDLALQTDASEILGCLAALPSELEAAVESINGGQIPAVEGLASQAEPRDEDFDEVGPAGREGPLAGSAYIAAAGRAASFAKLLGSCRGMQPAETLAHSILALYGRLHDAAVAPPEEVMTGLLEAAGEATAHTLDPQPLKELLTCLYSPRFALGSSNVGYMFALRQLERQAEAFQTNRAGEGRALTDDELEVLGGVHNLLLNLKNSMDDADAHSREGVRSTSAELRSAFGSAAAAVLRIDAEFLSEEDVEQLKAAILDGLGDSCYLVRRDAIEPSTSLLQLFDDSQKTFQLILGSIRVKESPDSESADMCEALETTLLTLGAAGVRAHEMELEAVLMICIQAAMHQPGRSLARAVLERMGAEMGYHDLPSYMTFHFLPFAYNWTMSCNLDISTLLSIRDIVTTRPGCVEKREFISEHSSQIVPCLLFKQARASQRLQSFGPQASTQHSRGGSQQLHDALQQAARDVELVSQTLGMSKQRLMEESFAVTLGLSFPGRNVDADGKTLIKAVVDDVMGEHLTGAARNDLLASKFVEVIGTILAVASADSDAGRPFFSVAVASKAITDLPGQQDTASNQNILHTQILDGDRFQQLLNGVHRAIAAGRHHHHVFQRLGSLQAFIKLAAQRVQEPPIFRYLVHILLRCLSFRELHVEVCSMLGALFGNLLEARGAPVLGPLLQPILLGLAEPVELEIAHWGRQAITEGHPLVTLVLGLTIQAPEHLHHHLTQVEPLPDHPVFDGARRLREKLRHSVSLGADVSNFAQHARAMPQGLRRHSLWLLQARLETEKARMRDERHIADREAVEAAAWQLVRENQVLADTDISDFVGQLLAFLGPLPPTAIAYTAPQPPSVSHAEGQEAEKGSAGAAFASMLTEALEQLAALLLDESAATVATAQTTLRQLLQTAEGLECLSNLDVVMKSYLLVFKEAAGQQSCDYTEGLSDKEWLLSDSQETGDLSAPGSASWVSRLASALLSLATTSVLRVCGRMMKLDGKFAELLLPQIFLEVAAQFPKEAGLRRAISRKVCQALQLPESGGSSLMLKVLGHLRKFYLDGLQEPRPKKRGSSWGDNLSMEAAPKSQITANWQKVYWLEIPYLEVAAAALSCGASMTALLYVEEWCKAEHGSLTIGPAPGILWKEEFPASEQLLLDIYSSIQEPDSIYAVARSHHLASLMPLLEHEGKWAQALVLHTLSARDSKDSGNQRGAVNAMKQLGWLDGIPSFLAGLEDSTPRKEWMEEEYCAAAWQLSRWEDMPRDQAVSGEQPGRLNSVVYTCLKALGSPDQVDCSDLLQSARQALVVSVSTASSETASHVNSSLIQLQMIEQLAEAQQLCSQDSGDRAGLLTQLLDVWHSREVIAGSGGRFELMDALHTLEKAVLRATGNAESLPPVLFRSAVAARKAGNLQKATIALHELRQAVCTQTPSEGKADIIGDLRWHVEEAKIAWANGQHRHALGLTQGLLANRALWPDERITVCQLMTLQGKWQQSSRSVSSAAVLAGMAAASQKLHRQQQPDDPEWQHQACRSAFRLAQYSDSLCSSAFAKMRSPEWASKKAVMTHKRQQVNQLKIQLASARSASEKQGLQRHIQQLRSLIQADEAELQVLDNARASFLWTAVDGFIRCLQCGSAYDMPATFRLVQLWLELGNSEDMNERMNYAVESVSSHKFLPLVYQMASRMSASQSASLTESGFQIVLSTMMVKLGTEHPHHTLYQLLALKNGNRNRAGRVDPSQGSTSGGMEQTMDMDKIMAATEVIQKIASGRQGKLVAQMEQLVAAYIELAAISPRKEAKSMPLSTSWVRKLKALDKAPVVSKSVAVDPSGRYEALPGISGFEDTITFVGGINKPKLIICVDDEGVRHRQLVKSGNDDLRQDAVMQQFFSLVNHLLHNAENTRKRQLKIRTYKVVPFSPFAGLLEWVEQTMPLSDYLMGSNKKSGAHKRFHKKDWSFHTCYERMYKAEAQEKLSTYLEVCQHFRPCLHYFFLERFTDPATWFERRLAYSRSTAVNSMAGYIIGLGDRHSANLLIDTANAEIVHIDLGIAFEQGKFLSTPERVPFRLTRDIVDGMGATGVEGVMRRSCEETLRVLRRNKEVLLTIIEVFIHDPLYRWALTPKGVEQRQNDDIPGTDQPARKPEQPIDIPVRVSETCTVATGSSLLAEPNSAEPSRQPRKADNTGAGAEEPVPSSTAGLVGNADAERALVRVKHKLEGLEEGEGEPRSVEGQVEQLLQEARDPERLSQMYIGWAPWV